MKKIIGYKTMAAAMMLSAFVSCDKVDDHDITPAVLLESVQIVFGEDEQDKIFTDETNAEVLPLITGERITLHIEATPDMSEATVPGVTWAVSDESIVSIDEDGVLTALQAGTALVTARPIAPSRNATSTIRVRIYDEVTPATALTLGHNAIMSVEDGGTEYPAFYMGESLTLTATIEPAESTYKTVRWSSSDESIATIDRRSGVTLGISAGWVEFTATALDPENPVSESIKMYVNEAEDPIGVRLGEVETMHSVDDPVYTIPFDVLPRFSTRSRLAWSTSDDTVATVQNGEVRFLKAGTVVITVETLNDDELDDASVADGYKKTTSVTLDIPVGYYNHRFIGTNFWTLNTNGATSSVRTDEQTGENYMYILPYDDGEKFRGDFKYSGTMQLNRNFPIVTFRIDDVRETWDGGDTGIARNITLDTNGVGSDGNEYRQELPSANNQWEKKYICSDNSAILIFNLNTQGFKTGGILPEGVTASLTTFQIKYADIKYPETCDYRFFWFRTFRSEEELMNVLAAWSAETGIEYRESSIK